jgi:hypothetical protein
LDIRCISPIDVPTLVGSELG